QQADRSGTHNSRPLWLPNSEATLNLVRLRNSFFDNRCWFKQHADFFESLRNLHDEFRVIDVIFTHVAMTKVDSTFEVSIVGRHVVGADKIVDARPGTTDGGDHIIARLYLRDVWTNGFDLAETFVADDQEVVSRRRLTIFGGIDFLVGAVDPD